MTGLAWRPPMVRYECPIGSCTWTHDAEDDPAVPEARQARYSAALAEWTPAGPVADAAYEQMLRCMLAADEIVKAHLETHSLLEWVTEIARLREVIDLTAIALSDSGQIGAFIRSAAAPGSPVAVARRECLDRLP